MVTYTDTLDGVTADMLVGFFDGWPTHPDTQTHLRLLQGSSEVVLAVDAGRVVGFVTAISDGVLSAYIPFLEVLPGYRHQGIGKELVREMLMKLKDYYMVDLTCDPELRSFYVEQGMTALTAMALRNRNMQSGRP